ncbi:hypothetical protein Q4Q52_05240 [Shewanella sp. SP1S2-4]|nr:hypothetical protein [Shewanella sp. SP1S2-4]
MAQKWNMHQDMLTPHCTTG